MRSRQIITFILTPALVLPVKTVQAQAPIERRPPALPSAPVPSLPVPSPGDVRAENAWENLGLMAARGARPEIRVQAMGEPIRCDLDAVTPYELFCVEHRAMREPIRDVLMPPVPYRVPRSDIRDVRIGGRDGSTALGAVIGAGVGVGLGSASAASRSSGGQLWGGLLFGLAGGFVGHFMPFKGHVVYQHP